jgi:hypothetical protein
MRAHPPRPPCSSSGRSGGRKRPRARLRWWAVSLLGCAALTTTCQAQTCSQHANCNGHGVCTPETGTCACFEGWGADTDVTVYRAADCSMRVCPAGRAWGDVPSSSTTAHAKAECSNRGLCDRSLGVCACFEGFEGGACERSKCIDGCSGHGRCVSMKSLASESGALPLSSSEYAYEGNADSTTWDEEKIYGCVCDSGWSVGLGNGETQSPEWFGPNCSLRRCPTGDDPSTTAVETDCYQDTTANDVYTGQTGATGNLCHVECSNQGTCDYTTGQCVCFEGYYGENCGSLSALATES